MLLTKSGLSLVFVLFVSIGLAACANSSKRFIYPVSQQEQIVWPGKPAEPRIRYIGSFSSAADLSIDKGFFVLLAEFFTGTEQQHMVRPMAVLAPTDNEIYVADPGISGVHYFNLKTGDYKQIRLADNIPLPSPVALTIDNKQIVMVADSALGKIFSINLQAGIVEELPLQATLKQPTGLAYDLAQQLLYVADTATHSINVFNQQGDLLRKTGHRGDAKGEFNFPTFLWHDSKVGLLVTDTLNFRVQNFDASGQYVGHFGKVGSGSGSFSRPKGIASDSLGHIYVVDSLFHAFQIFDKKGRLLLNVGQQGQNSGEFWLPVGIYVSNSNKIYVADSFNQRIQVFQYIEEDI